MNGINTAEQFLIAEYEKLQEENSNLQQENSNLQAQVNELSACPDIVDQEDNPVEHSVSMWKLDEPIELAYLNVKDYYTMHNSDNPLKLTADEIRKHISEKTLDEIVDMKCGYSYSTSPLVYVDVFVFPYTLRIGKHCFGLDVYMSNGNPANVNVYKCEDGSKLRDGVYFPAKYEDELYKYGLRLLEKQLEKHLEWLEENGKTGKWWEVKE